MEKVEKKLTRFRANLKTKRKLSLPMFINHFNQQWAETNNLNGVRSGCRDAESVREEEEPRENLTDTADGLRNKQNRRHSQGTRHSSRGKGVLLSSNLITSSNNFGSLASIGCEADHQALKRNLSHSTSSGSASSGSRHRTNSTASSISSDSSSNSLNSSTKRHYSTLPHSASAAGLHLKLNQGHRSSSTLPLSTSCVPRKKSTKGNGQETTPIIPGGIVKSSSVSSACTGQGLDGSMLPRDGHVCGTGAVKCRGDRCRGRHWSHPQLVATISSPGGSTFTTFVVPSDGSSVGNSNQASTDNLSAPPANDPSPDTTSPDTPDDKSSQDSLSRRGVSGLRQCDSLENVCDRGDDRLLDHGNGLAAQPAAVNASSLPHINQAVSYDQQQKQLEQHQRSSTDRLASHLLQQQNNCSNQGAHPPLGGCNQQPIAGPGGLPLHLPTQPLYINPNLQLHQQYSNQQQQADYQQQQPGGGADGNTTSGGNNGCPVSAADAANARWQQDDGAGNKDEGSEEPQTKFGKRSDKSHKSKLKRRPPYTRRQKDASASGRSKSLTHIDTLGGEGSPATGAMLGGSDDGGGAEGGGWPVGEAGHQLGVPDEHSHRRRKLSLHSKVSSSEYIHVVWDGVGGGDPGEEFIPAVRGTTLRETLERRGFDLVGSSLVLEDTTTMVPPTAEASVLAGRTLRYRSRDASRSPVRTRSAGPSPGQLSTRKHQNTRAAQGWFHRSAASTEECSPLGEDRPNGAPPHDTAKAAKATKPNNRWSIFPTKEPRMDALVQRLDHYSKHGIPQQPHLLFSADQEGQDHEVSLEAGGWRDVVQGWQELTERLCQQQSAIWELVETEATYIQMIRVITNLFLSCLCNLQNDSLLNEINTELLFSNIPEIYRSNMVFWQEHVSGMLAEARKTKQPLNPTLLYDAFTNFTELFQPYTQYCLQQTQCQQYCKDRYHDNEHFKLYLAWCETQKECNRLRLVDIVVQPMQRLTKYSLLLKAILKKTDIDEHRWKLQEMISHVERFVSNVNSALRHRHEQDRLRDTINRIELYDAVEAKEEEMAAKVKQYSELQLSQPMPGCPEHLSRHLLHQGDYRLRDNNTSKTDVHVFIFTDLLLITKVTQRKAEKVKVIRPPFNVERLVEVVSSGRDSTTLGLIVLTEWGVPSAAFSLTSPDLMAHRALQGAIKKAKKQYLDAQSGGRDLLEEITSGLRSPRLVSSRASRGSSLAPSQSGSVDLTDPGPPHTTSPAMLEVSELRASSASSEDSVEGPRLGQHSVDSSSRTTTGQHLSVTASHASGQSLPNLSVASGGNSHLKVPSTHKNLAPWNRGVSYPPPSPRALRRSPPVPQSRNPPLLKTRHVVSTTCAMGSNHGPATGAAAEAAGQQGQYEEEDPCRSPRRICRSDRLDNRRYHTTGAIDDIKKQDTKDSSIHKRLSWNYGQQQPAPQPPLQQQVQQASAPGGLCTSCSAQTFVTPSNSTCSSTSSRLTCSSTASSRLTGGHCDGRRHKLSCESMHSSSGVSSTSSLHRSVTSEVETIENMDDSELSECDRTIVDLGIGEFGGGGDALLGGAGVDYGVGARFSPHISSTYICQDALGMVGVGGSCATQYITQHPLEGAENEEGALSPAMVTIDVSNACGNIPSAVQITVTEGPNPSSENSLDACDSRLTDASEPSYGTDPALSFTPASPVHTPAGPAAIPPRTSVGPPPTHTLSAVTHPSVVPPEVPPRSSSPKIPVQRTLRQSPNPVPSATSQSSGGDSAGQRPLRCPRTETQCKSTDKNTHAESALRQIPSAIGASETIAELGQCIGETSNSAVGGDGGGSSSSTNTIVATDDESLDSPSSAVSRLGNSCESRSSSTVASSAKKEDPFTPAQASSKTISTPDSNSSTASLASCSSSTLSASSSSSTSSFSSSASSSKCASNSYASLSSPASSSSSSLSKQSLSRESGVRELLLSDAAVETSDV